MWHYEGKEFKEAPEGYEGFIYKITCIHPDLLDKVYVGRKSFLHKTKKAVSKKVIKETGTRKRVERGTKDSGWNNYFGSCKILTEDIKTYGKEHFHREILMFCTSKAELTYWEAYYQFTEEVLIKDSYNGWISCKCYRSRLN